MKLGDLCASHAQVLGQSLSPEASELFVFGVTNDSRDVRFGHIFCAIPSSQNDDLNDGKKRKDGIDFCPDAAKNGAQVIVIDNNDSKERLPLSEYEREKIVVLRVKDVKLAYAKLAAHFYSGGPAAIAAVTGTNGKTSTVSFLRDIWIDNGHLALSLGTLGLTGRGKRHTNLEASLTTFDAKTLHIMLGELERVHGVTHLAMEASSHALDQQRLGGLTFAAVAFTNFTQDHLDYHKTMDAYFVAKTKLFSDLIAPDGVAVINVRDSKSSQLMELTKAKGCRTICYGEAEHDADLRLIKREPHESGQTLRLSLWGTEYIAEAPLAGIFQSENILCALGLAVGTGVPVERAVSSIPHLSSVPGRLERIAVLRNGASVYVDYAHTPDALDNVLRSMRPHVGKAGRLHVVFGCGGDRDPKKRPIMGRIAVDRADCVWVTDDNPRTQDPADIRAQVMGGAVGATDAGPRRDALERAITSLRTGDVLVVAGKGHEDYQILLERTNSGEPVLDAQGKMKTYKMPFSDAGVVREICSAL